MNTIRGYLKSNGGSIRAATQAAVFKIKKIQNTKEKYLWN